MQNAVAKMSLQDKLGPQRGEQVWQADRGQNDPEAVSTVHDGRSFPYGGSPEHPEGVAMPDPGSVTEQQFVFDPGGSANEHGTPGKRNSAADKPRPARELSADEQVDSLRGMFDGGVVPENMGERRGMSNALMVSGEQNDDPGKQVGDGHQGSAFLGGWYGPGIQGRPRRAR